MTNTVRFNVGGKLYQVSRSLLDMHPNTMLAQSASEQWLQNPDAEVFVERDGIRFGYVLDYLRDDGSVILPMTVPKPSFLADLVYYGVENVDESKIVCFHDHDPSHLSDIKDCVHERVVSETETWFDHCTVVSLAKECAVRYLASGGKLQFDLCGKCADYIEREDILLCPDRTFMALWICIINDDGMSLFSTQYECNKYLSKVGLNLVSLKLVPLKNLIQVSMKLTDT